MNIKSLGLKTDIFFINFNGVVEEKDDYYVVRTPSNPEFWFGNYIIFKQPPGSDDFERWKTVFKDEIRKDHRIKHMVFTWDVITGEQGDLTQFIDSGFKIEQDIVLCTGNINIPKKINSHVTIRKLQTDDEWEQAFANQMACREDNFGESLEDHIKFKREHMNNYRAMSQQQLGDWYGAFLGNQLVFDMGLFFVDGIGRFQSVGTHPDFRRQAICSTAVYEISKKALEDKKADYLVMVADENYHAAKIYESIGYRPSERLVNILHPNFFQNQAE